ncbi:MAG: cytochrome c biogenesis CcdA family protein [Actinomycetota bacterium]
MGGLLTTGSLLAAFFAGAVALFAPCCIVFLLPSYLAAAAKNRRWRLLPLTFVFAAGLGLVLLPVTLGVGLVAAAVNRYHIPLYLAGGALMLALAGLALSGRMWQLPSLLRSPDPGRGDTAGMFALGVFSGVASSCCAPVLAGVMTLSALAGTPFGAASLGLAFVFGMTFPLFVLALFWDRWRLGERRWLAARPLRATVGRRTLHTNSVNVAVAGVFAAMGILVITLALTGNTTAAPGVQLGIARFLDRAFKDALGVLRPVPEPVLGVGVLALAAVFIVAALRDRTRHGKRSEHGPEHEDPTDHETACH